MTKIEHAIRDNFCSFFEADVTSMFIRFSILTCVRSPCEEFPDGEICLFSVSFAVCAFAAAHPGRASSKPQQFSQPFHKPFRFLMHMANTPRTPTGTREAS